MIAVLFEAEARPEALARYVELAAEMKPLLADVPGFVSVERFQSLHQPGKILSLSWWRDEASIAAWKQNEKHQIARLEGKQSIFAHYSIRVAHVLRDYASEKGDSVHV